MIFRRLFAARRRPDPSGDMYRRIVEQARRPILYAELGVPDSVDGRFEMITLHAFLVLHRLKDGNAEAKAFAQAVFDAMFADMDRSLREMGVGDLSVPKKMKAMAAAFYGRVAAYDSALAVEEPAALEAAIARNVLGEDDVSPGASRLAAYLREAAALLARQPEARLLMGTVEFPDPAAMQAKEAHAP